MAIYSIINNTLKKYLILMQRGGNWLKENTNPGTGSEEQSIRMKNKIIKKE